MYAAVVFAVLTLSVLLPQNDAAVSSFNPCVVNSLGGMLLAIACLVPSSYYLKFQPEQKFQGAKFVAKLPYFQDLHA